MRREVSRVIDLERDEKTVAPIIAHKLWGKAGPDGLTGGQRRQVAEFAAAIVKALRDAGRLK